MEKYDIPLERIYAFGDSNNDLDMLRYVQNSIAMGVCTEEVAEAASSAVRRYGENRTASRKPCGILG